MFPSAETLELFTTGAFRSSILLGFLGLATTDATQL